MAFASGSSDHSAEVVRIFRGEVCLGTGFLISPDRVLTCFHVVEHDTDKPLRVRLSDGAIQDGKLEAISETEAHDLALIRIPKQKARKPVRFLIGLKAHHENALCKLNWQAFGCDSRDCEMFPSDTSVCREPAFQRNSKTGTLLDVQVNLGLPNGFSGAPVLIEVSGKSLCIGIVTQGGVDSAKSRIRFSDCIVGFLEESGLKVESEDASVALPKAPALASQGVAGRKQNRSWRWAAPIGLLAAVVFAGLYFFPKPPQDVKGNVQHTGNSTPAPPAPPFYRVQIMMYSSATPPQLYINKKQAKLDEYDGRTATLQLRPGNYHVEADYMDRICTAVVAVSHNMSTEAECHLK